MFIKIITSKYAAIFILGVLMIWGSCDSSMSTTESSIATSMSGVVPDVVDFNFHVKPILSDRCFTCHGPDPETQEAGLAFHIKDMAFAALGDDLDHYAILPGKADSSTLVSRIFSDDPNDVMPPPESNLALEPFEKEILKKWIEQGAVWKEHWAFINPVDHELPSVNNDAWTQNDIDYFVLSQIESYNLQPSERAPKEALIRRASFDLTGLPPTLSDIEAYLADDGVDAFEKVIDRLLSTDAYAERMAVDWLDISRYSDTNGYQDDFERFNWPWRDWVIHAFKKNMPYDEFVTWQLAGDMMPDPTLEQVVATGFNRNHKITNEGGVIPEEYRVEYVSDRTNTFATAFLGLTMECAKCHDHKYDPLSQKNYYELYSFFNNVPEEGFVANGQKASPTITLTEKEISEKLAFINTLDSMENIEYMVMEEMETPRQAHILSRGAYDKPTTPVGPNTPESILEFTDEYEKNRLGLAKWLFDGEHPLTARVTVNRLWQQLFGTGIVATTEDFGNQGSLPSHPELLDHLAIEMQENEWDIKKMLKYIMMSSTYQQSTKIDPDLLELDPENRLLARAPRLRLPAEMIRDHALKISDLLVEDIGGPSVKPYQPAGLWAETTGGGGGSTSRYVEDSDNGLYRRSLYTFWKRTVPPPSMMTFDAASRDLCTVKRQNTSTPLQALVLLNDPQIVEAARMLAYRSLEERSGKEKDNEVSDHISYMFHMATSRKPNDGEVASLKQYFDEELERYNETPEDAERFLSVGNYQMKPDEENAPRLAAFASVASAIINLDETITRG